MSGSLAKSSKLYDINLLFLTALIVSNCLMLAPEGGGLRLVGVLTLLLLPGLVWAECLALSDNLLIRWTVGFGLSYALIVIFGLLLHYIPGPIPTWVVLALFNILTLTAIIVGIAAGRAQGGVSTQVRCVIFLVLLVILLWGAFFRFANLGYSEFDGDEVKALTPAAEVIEGRVDALFYQRNKGPGEILIPMMLWRLTGVINELSARMLFALTGVLSIVAIYLLGSELAEQKVGLMAAGLLALNGFMVAFSRIVQYQQIVIWMSLLSLLCAWQWYKSGQTGWGVLTGLFFGIGLLAHYDVILVGPALIYLGVVRSRSSLSGYTALFAMALSLLVVASLFFVPFGLSPQVATTGGYLGQRIGLDLLKNNLFDFFHVTIFYNSLYYMMVIGLLVLGFLAWATAHCYGLNRFRQGRYILSLLITMAAVVVSLKPDALTMLDMDFAFIPFSLLFLGAFYSRAVKHEHRLLIIWLGTAFLGYNFLVASPRTHFYTILPPLILVAVLTAAWLWDRLASNPRRYFLPVAGCLAFAVLLSGYLYQAFLRTSVEFEVDWPESQLPLYWFPYDDIPKLDAYGFLHKHGWKAVGGLYASGQIVGDYETNAMHSKTNWYTRNAMGDGCYGQTENFFALRHMAIDPIVFGDYEQIGEVAVSNNQKGINILRRKPVSDDRNPLPVEYLSEVFDRTAKPTAFVRPLTESYSVNVNLADAIHLIGYDIKVAGLKPGEYISISLYWKPQKGIPVDLDVFVHLEDEQNQTIWGQSDGSPDCGEHPTSTWQPGQVIEDTHIIQISLDTPPGDYILTAGLYLPADSVRVPILDETGQTVSNSFVLTRLTLQ